MEFFSTEFQRETPELSTPGLSTPSEPLVTASPMSAFDLYRHNRVWESNSYLRSRQKWGLIEQIFIIDCKCHILIHVIMYVLIIKFNDMHQNYSIFFQVLILSCKCSPFYLLAVTYNYWVYWLHMKIDLL